MGRKLAARVLKSWLEDFVDEDTGEVVSIEQNGDPRSGHAARKGSHQEILMRTFLPFFCTARTQSMRTTRSSTTRFKKMTNSEKAVEHIIVSWKCRAARQGDGTGIIDKLFFSRPIISASRSLPSEQETGARDRSRCTGTDQGRHHSHHQIPDRTYQLQGEVDDIDHLSNRRCVQ